MLDEEFRIAVYRLHHEGMGNREISRRLKISRNTVKKIINQKGEMPLVVRKDKISVPPDLLEQLYLECDGRIQRVYEKLTEEKNIHIGYSTLARLLRELKISDSQDSRCDQKPDIPGQEIQHDTSPYQILLGKKKVKVVASLLYYRYSKIRYLKFYRSFNRFKMKFFFHEALSHWGYCAKRCIIDNTNLARLRGTGKNAVIVPEMAIFSKRYGFEYECHEVNHSNRKAGNERSFYTVETNFFAGRNFSTLEDLNRQAFEWATVRMANRPVSKTRLIPSIAFEHEKIFLNALPVHIPAPYLSFKRKIDQYGYVSFEANYYWIPGSGRGEVTVLRYNQMILIYNKRKRLVEYQLPPDGVKNQKFVPKGFSGPFYQPANRKKSTSDELQYLCSISEEIRNFMVSMKEKGLQKHRFIRGIFRLSKKIDRQVFIKAIKRASNYGITDIETIENICSMLITDSCVSLPQVDVDADFYNRKSYLDGQFGAETDLTAYDLLLDGEDNE